MTELEVNAGKVKWPLKVAPSRLLTPLRISSAATASPHDLVAESLEHPVRFEALRRALTPDDHVCIVLDERLPHLAAMAAAILEHLISAGIDPDAVTLLSPDPHSKQAWLEALPDELSDVKAELHQPKDMKKLAYLATTKAGQRVYMNRTAVESEFVIVLAAHRFDSRNAESFLGHDIADHETQVAVLKPEEFAEVAWLLGAPFFVRVIEGPGESIDSVVSGFAESVKDADAVRDARWQTTVKHLAEIVIATVPEADANFADLAVALTCAANAVKPGGRIVLATAATPDWPDAVKYFSEGRESVSIAKRLKKDMPDGWADAIAWLDAASQASLFIAADWSAEQVELLQGTPLANAAELQRLLEGDGKVLVIEDAHRSKIIIAASTP